MRHRQRALSTLKQKAESTGIIRGTGRKPKGRAESTGHKSTGKTNNNSRVESLSFRWLSVFTHLFTISFLNEMLQHCCVNGKVFQKYSLCGCESFLWKGTFSKTSGHVWTVVSSLLFNPVLSSTIITIFSGIMDHKKNDLHDQFKEVFNKSFICCFL